MEEAISYANQRILIVSRAIIVVVIENVIIINEWCVGSWIIFGIHIWR